MADQAQADDVESTLNDVDLRDERELVDVYDALTDADIEWEVSVESDALTEEQRDTLVDVLYHTVGTYRFIVGKDRYIPRGVYWTLVSEYADEVMETLDEDPEWADSALDIFREIIMPTEMARFYEADPVANFSVLYHSKHHAEGWLTEMESDYFGTDFTEYVEDEGWKKALSTMAYAACVQDVAQKVRSEEYEVDIEHFEYRNDL